ncbi:MAG: hypothetical protein EOP49_34085 [Sphingobacteriales bacterium]|nr:MAG: hypothetical protein EOP49_34085 [Sphingobacteriales bacterium]
MYSQFFVFLCSLLFVRSGTEPKTDRISESRDRLRNISTYVQADNQYGWQVAGRTISSYELATK